MRAAFDALLGVRPGVRLVALHIAVTAYQSQTSLLRRLAAESPAVGSALIVSLAPVLAALVLRVDPRRPHDACRTAPRSREDG